MKILRFGIVLLLSVTLWGCGKGNSSAPITIDPSTGKHPTGTAVASTGGSHVDAYFASPSGCEGCHGKPEDLSGGIVKVSCSTNTRDGMTCHAGKFPHGVGFDVPTVHGQKVTNAPTGTNGLAFCKKCHGSNYKGIAGSGVSCIGCHQLANAANNAPHAANWLAGSLPHSATDQANAPACGECHLGGKLLTTPVPLPAGTPAPTCFGTTALCHFEAGHANPYISKNDHGLAAHANLGRCIPCHADYPAGSTVPNFSRVRGTTNLSPNGCQNCHTQPGLAHPYGWLPGRGNVGNTTSHATASLGTAGANCSPCHALTGTANLPNSVAPSCMTQAAQIGGTTYCHFTASPVANPTGCASCHANTPSGPNGSAAPNRNGRHSTHFAMITTGLVCADCHGVYGSGRTDHATRTTAQLSIAAKFSDTGVGYTSPTCSAVSCHGGQSVAWTSTTPLGCLNCHHLVDTVGNTGGQYINVYNGDRETPIDPTGNTGYMSSNLHVLHSGEVVVLQCTQCHDTAKLATLHFANILTGNTKTFAPGVAAGTLGNPTDTLNKIISYSYTGTPGQKSSCLTKAGCHGSTAKSWFQ